jgi:hypothetical protein
MNYDTHVAFALHSGVVHLCVDARRTRKAPVESLCRQVILNAPRAPVDPADLGNIQNFIICKGCEARFNLMGYRKFYAQEQITERQHPNQLPLF